MTVREQSIGERKRKKSVSNLFYLTHPVAINTSTVRYMTQLGLAGNMEDAKYNFRLHAVVLFVESAKENITFILLLLLVLFLPLSLFTLKSHIF